MATFEEQITSMVRQKIMEEINGLGIRAAIREEIEASGVTKGKVRELVENAVDSYVRSVDVEALVNRLIENNVRHAVAAKLREYVDGWGVATALLQDVIKTEIAREWSREYTARVSIEKKGD